jgi:adenosylhomocysteine nucleosidase
MPAINIIVALHPEARPVNRHLGLVRDNRHDRYPLYRQAGVSLVISGPGMAAASAAVEWLHDVHEGRNGDIWINLGIAGHPDHHLGEIFQAALIENRHSGQQWRLPARGDLPCPAETVSSVLQPDDSYTLNSLVEMEAAGFYPSALQYTDASMIHCLKVVSDNRNNPAAGINGKQVTRLITGHMDILDRLIAIHSHDGRER